MIWIWNSDETCNFIETPYNQTAHYLYEYFGPVIKRFLKKKREIACSFPFKWNYFFKKINHLFRRKIFLKKNEWNWLATKFLQILVTGVGRQSANVQIGSGQLFGSCRRRWAARTVAAVGSAASGASAASTSASSAATASATVAAAARVTVATAAT